MKMLKKGFIALTVLGLVLLIVGGFRLIGSFGNAYTFSGSQLFVWGAAGWFVVWLFTRSAHDKRAGPPDLEDGN
jgi:hypothetical protein